MRQQPKKFESSLERKANRAFKLRVREVIENERYQSRSIGNRINTGEDDEDYDDESDVDSFSSILSSK